jgi:hypothetical protein
MSPALEGRAGKDEAVLPCTLQFDAQYLALNFVPMDSPNALPLPETILFISHNAY